MLQRNNLNNLSENINRGLKLTSRWAFLCSASWAPSCFFSGLPRYSEAEEGGRMCHHEPNTSHALWISSHRGRILHNYLYNYKNLHMINAADLWPEYLKSLFSFVCSLHWCVCAEHLHMRACTSVFSLWPHGEALQIKSFKGRALLMSVNCCDSEGAAVLLSIRHTSSSPFPLLYSCCLTTFTPVSHCPLITPPNRCSLLSQSSSSSLPCLLSLEASYLLWGREEKPEIIRPSVNMSFP